MPKPKSKKAKKPAKKKYPKGSIMPGLMKGKKPIFRKGKPISHRM